MYGGKAKGILVEGIKKNGDLIDIDRIEESELKSDFATQKRTVYYRNLLIGAKFTIFDTWESYGPYYSGLSRITIFGSFNENLFHSCPHNNRYFINKKLLFYLLLSVS